MSVQIVDDAVPVVAARRVKGHLLRIECPYCRHTRGWKRGQPKFHIHGSGGKPGPCYGYRLAHCADSDLPPALRERQRHGPFLQYELVDEASQPHTIKAPPLQPLKRRPARRVVIG